LAPEAVKTTLEFIFWSACGVYERKNLSRIVDSWISHKNSWIQGWNFWIQAENLWIEAQNLWITSVDFAYNTPCCTNKE
jgi:hypothetical protein